MTIVRPATLEDVDALVALGLRFAAETPYAQFLHVDPERLRQSITGFVTQDMWIALVLAHATGVIVGMLGMMVAPHPFSAETMAYEIAWWVNPESRRDGVRLLREAERIAVERGATRIQMVAPDARVGEFYARLGYEEVERAYQRTLGAV